MEVERTVILGAARMPFGKCGEVGSLGHLINACGARIPMTLLYQLGRRGGGKELGAMCSGGGQGDAVLVEV